MIQTVFQKLFRGFDHFFIGKNVFRTRVAEQVLENYGYFGSRASDSLLHRKHGRKAKVNYTLRIAPPFRYSEITYPAVGGGLKPLIDSLHATSLLRTGAQYNLDTLTLERQRIARLLRNRGYYYFRPEYLEYLADTTISPQRVAVRLNLKPNTPEVALNPYRVGDITVRLTNKGTGEFIDQDVFMGDFPLMTDTGSFIINGAERVIVSQLVRSPGVYCDILRDKNGKPVYNTTAMPTRGAW